MSNKKKRAILDEKRAKKQAAAERARREALPDGAEFPRGVIAADLTQQAPNNSYAGSPLYYADQPFNCVDCGAAEVWTAADQKWYFEVVKGPIYGRAVRCLACRRKRRHET